jgi:hypothetical protein
VGGCPLLLYCSTSPSTLLNPFIYKGFKKKVEESRGEMEKEEEGGKKKVDGNWAIRIFLD